jgi:WD40 repeat protein
MGIDVDLSPDGRLLLWMSLAGVRVWEVSSGKVVHVWEGQLGQFTPDGKKIVIATPQAHEAGSYLQLYDTESGALLHKFGRHPKGLWLFLVSPDGQTALTGDPDGIGRV